MWCSIAQPYPTLMVVAASCATTHIRRSSHRCSNFSSFCITANVKDYFYYKKVTEPAGNGLLVLRRVYPRAASFGLHGDAFRPVLDPLAACRQSRHGLVPWVGLKQDNCGRRNASSFIEGRASPYRLVFRNLVVALSLRSYQTSGRRFSPTAPSG